MECDCTWFWFLSCLRINSFIYIIQLYIYFWQLNQIIKPTWHVINHVEICFVLILWNLVTFEHVCQNFVITNKQKWPSFIFTNLCSEFFTELWNVCVHQTNTPTHSFKAPKHPSMKNLPHLIRKRSQASMFILQGMENTSYGFWQVQPNTVCLYTQYLQQYTTIFLSCVYWLWSQNKSRQFSFRFTVDGVCAKDVQMVSSTLKVLQ